MRAGRTGSHSKNSISIIKNHDTMNHDIIRVYNSIQEFSASLNRETNKVFKDAELRSNIPDEKGFKGTSDFETADKYLKYGDSENLSRIQAVRVQGSNKAGTEIRSRQCNGVVGKIGRASCRERV